jgi:hypothetical protein
MSSFIVSILRRQIIAQVQVILAQKKYYNCLLLPSHAVGAHLLEENLII